MRTKYQVAMHRTWTTWFEIDAQSQEEAEQIFKTMMGDQSLYEEELNQLNVTQEYYELYEDLSLIKEIQ